MKDPRLGIPTPALLAKAAEKLDAVRMDDWDTKGDVYEYMLSKIATAGQNGQFRTPRHIIALMVELSEPTPTDIICDPAAGTCGFLVAAGEYLRRRHPRCCAIKAAQGFPGNHIQRLRLRRHNAPHRRNEHDAAWSRKTRTSYIGISLAEEHYADTGRYNLVLANPPFAGAIDYESCAKDLKQILKDQKNRASFSRAVPAAAQSGRTYRRYHAARRAIRLVQSS